MTKYIRIKSGRQVFKLVERFDDVADPNAKG